MLVFDLGLGLGQLALAFGVLTLLTSLKIVRQPNPPGLQIMNSFMSCLAFFCAGFIKIYAGKMWKY